MTHDVLEITRSVAYAYGVPQLAAKMGMQIGTLYNKLNLDESCHHHKLSLQDLIHIMNITGDIRPLAAMAALFNHAVYCLPEQNGLADEALLDLVNKTQINAGVAHLAMAESLADGSVSPQEFARIARDCHEWLSAIIALKCRFKSMVVLVDEQRCP